MAKGKKAWVRYDDGAKSGEEKYELLLWDEKNKEWGLDLATRFVADAEHPDAGKQFVHYSLITEVLYLIGRGYSVEI